jgi:hypothetical protein
MSRECAIILMDSTPLIDLAQVGQLDLLLAFDLPIYIADEVYYECVHKYRDLHGVDLPDSLIIKEWVKKNSARVSVKETQLGRMLADARRNHTYRDAPNYGEMAAAQLYDERKRFNQAHGAASLAPVLLIYDDADVPPMQFGGKDVHFLSTYGLLVAVEKQGLIPSADELWDRIPEKQRGLREQDKKHLQPRDESARGDTTYPKPKRG